MPFSDPIVAGEELIRSAIKSENYSDGSDGNPATGWRISRNGDADFNNVYVRGDVDGESGSFDNLSAQSSFIYRGEELGDLLERAPRGVVAFSQCADGTSTTTENDVLELSVDMDANRQYAIRTSLIGIGGGSTNGGIVIRYTTDGSAPGLSSPIMAYCTNSAQDRKVQIDTVTIRPTAQTLRLLLTVISFSGTATLVHDFAEGDISMWVVDEGIAVQNTGIPDPLSGSSPVLEYRTFDVGFTDIRSYESDGSYHNNTLMYQGKVPGFNSRRVGWNWFNIGSAGSASIADLSGVPAGQLVYLDAYLSYPHWYNSGGGICVLGYHNVAAVPAIGAGEPGGGIVDKRQETYTARNQGRWFTLFGTDIGNAILAGTFRGFLTGDHSINTSTTFYGYASDVRIRAGYYK